MELTRSMLNGEWFGELLWWQDMLSDLKQACKNGKLIDPLSGFMREAVNEYVYRVLY